MVAVVPETGHDQGPEAFNGGEGFFEPGGALGDFVGKFIDGAVFGIFEHDSVAGEIEIEDTVEGFAGGIADIDDGADADLPAGEVDGLLFAAIERGRWR